MQIEREGFVLIYQWFNGLMVQRRNVTTSCPERSLGGKTAIVTIVSGLIYSITIRIIRHKDLNLMIKSDNSKRKSMNGEEILMKIKYYETQRIPHSPPLALTPSFFLCAIAPLRRCTTVPSRCHRERSEAISSFMPATIVLSCSICSCCSLIASTSTGPILS